MMMTIEEGYDLNPIHFLTVPLVQSPHISEGTKENKSQAILVNYSHCNGKCHGHCTVTVTCMVKTNSHCTLSYCGQSVDDDNGRGV